MRRVLLALIAAFVLGAASFLLLRFVRVWPAFELVPYKSPFEVMPHLADVSVWRLDSTEEGGGRGAFSLGNGSAFAILGLSRPVNTLENIIGPRYQKQVGFLGRWSTLLERKGRPLRLPDWVAARVRGTALVLTRERGDGVTLYTVNCAPGPSWGEVPALLREVWVTNESERPLKGLSVLHKFERHVEGVDKKQRLVFLSHGEIKMAFGTVRGELPRVSEKGLIFRLPEIPPGQSVRISSFLTIGDSWEEAREFSRLLRSRQACWPLNMWRGWRERGLRLRTPDERVNDFLDTALVLCKAQQAAFGGFSPMHGYTFYWIRDANGPIRLFLTCGFFDDVKRCLDWHFRACSSLGKVPNSLSLDINVKSPPKVEWAESPVPRAEIASFLVLQHLWYWRATGDISLAKSCLPMLERCIFGQELRPDGRLPFHADETYRFPGYFFFEQTGKFPTDYVHLSTLSADSAFEFVSACEGLAEIERELGREGMAQKLSRLAKFVRKATERFYWMEDLGLYSPSSSPLSDWQVHPAPFANINLRPLWVGYLAPHDPKAIRNLLQTVSMLSRGDGMIKTTPSFGYYTGMVPGYLLYNLAAVDHPGAESALEALLRAVTPAGEFCEMHLPSDRPAVRGKHWGFHHLRPWETGINAEAVVFYLLGIRQNAPGRGLEICPRLPSGWAEMDAEGIRCGDSILSLEVRDLGGRRVYRIRQERGNKPLKIFLRLSLPARGILKVSLDGRPASFGKRRQFGREGALLNFETMPGQERIVEVAYAPESAPPKSIPLKSLPEPKVNPPLADVVVVTGDPKLVGSYRRKHRKVLPLDPRLYLPEKWVVEALSRAKLIVFDDVLPGPFKPPDFWERPAIKRTLEEAKKRGAKVVYLKRPEGREFVRLKRVEEEVE